MKVVYVCADRGIPLRGGKGASVHVRHITWALQQLGHEVTVAVRNASGDACAPVVSEVVRLPSERHAQEAVLAPVIDAADLVVERYSLDTGAARVRSTASDVPYVLEVNAPLVAEAGRYRGLQDLPSWFRWEDETWAAADAVVAVSRPLAEQVARRAPGTSVHLLRNGVAKVPPVDRDKARAALGLQPEQLAVVFAGSMKPWHGVLQLLDAAAGLDDQVQVLLAGHGPLDEVVRDQAERSGGRVRALGAVPHDAMPALLAACDVGVAPYLPVPDFYFCPLKVMEYLTAGLPVVYSDEGDISEIVGPAGLGVSAGDADALRDALQRMHKDPALRASAATQAQPRVASAGWPDVATRLLDVAGGLR